MCCLKGGSFLCNAVVSIVAKIFNHLSPVTSTEKIQKGHKTSQTWLSRQL